MRTQGYQNAETKRLIRATQRIEGSLQNTSNNMKINGTLFVFIQGPVNTNLGIESDRTGIFGYFEKSNKRVREIQCLEDRNAWANDL